MLDVTISSILLFSRQIPDTSSEISRDGSLPHKGINPACDIYFPGDVFLCSQSLKTPWRQVFKVSYFGGPGGPVVLATEAAGQIMKWINGIPAPVGEKIKNMAVHNNAVP